MKKNEAYLFIRIVITISPFIALALAIHNRITYDHWIPPVVELIALGLIIFSNSYLLIESLIMRSKGLNKKMNHNYVLTIVSSLLFFSIAYLLLLMG